MNSVRLVLAAAAMVATAAPVVAQPQPVGVVNRLAGTAHAANLGEVRSLTAGGAVFAQDAITTALRTRLEIVFADGSVVTLGDETLFAIEAFQFDAASGERTAMLRVADGVFRAVIAGLAGIGADGMMVTTPVATIGIRGTDFWGALRVDSLTVALLGGAGVFVVNEAGRVDLTAVGDSAQVGGLDVAPRGPERLSDRQLQEAAATVSFEGVD